MPTVRPVSALCLAAHITSAAGGLFYGGAEKSAFKNGASIAGRVTYAPIAEKTRVVHVGGGILYRNNFKENELRLRARPEIHLANRAIDTGTIEGVDGATSYNAELAGVYGPYSVQGEYFRSSLNRSKDAKNPPPSTAIMWKPPGG